VRVSTDKRAGPRLAELTITADDGHAADCTAAATRITELTGHAIRAWRHLAGLDKPTSVNNRGKVVLKAVFSPSHQRASKMVVATIGSARG
jgi:hypothetical protein